MERIVNSRGKQYTVLYDDEDSSLVSEYNRWFIRYNKKGMPCSVTLIIRTKDKKIQSAIPIHRLIMGVSDPAIYIDHRNHNVLDNRKENLRLCTPIESSRNRRSWGKTSKYFGVCLDKKSGLFNAQISLKKGSIFSIVFTESEELAARLYDSAAYHYFGEFANLNFPEKTPLPFVPFEDYPKILEDGISDYFTKHESGSLTDIAKHIQASNPHALITNQKIKNIISRDKVKYPSKETYQKGVGNSLVIYKLNNNQ